ncbi:MAG: DNA-binding response regulator [Chloroflexi bacterium RBG_16_56_8]|nr:MAG: DNA-binding response regulator [Chloroflexi bacterium RBG_16_56_8]
MTPVTSVINVLIVDDHALIREGVKKTLSGETDMAVVGEANDVMELFKQLERVRVNVVLLDITMPGESGLDALKELHQKYPQVPVLVLSFHPEHRFAIRALKTGASGYITKASATEELVQAVRKIASGGKYVSAALAEQLASELTDERGRPPHETLSDREFQVMRLFAEGKKSSEIAAALSVSVSTVNTYRMRILEKMKMQSNVELARYAFEHGLIE